MQLHMLYAYEVMILVMLVHVDYLEDDYFLQYTWVSIQNILMPMIVKTIYIIIILKFFVLLRGKLRNLRAQ